MNQVNLMHPLYGALPGPYVPVRVTLGALIAHLFTNSIFRCRTLQYRRTLIPLSMGLDRVSRARPMLFHLPKLLNSFLSSTIFPFHFFQDSAVKYMG